MRTIIQRKCHRAANVFCVNSSLRGVGKIYKSKNLFLRFLWLIYVVTMLFLLLHSSIKILKEYLDYTTCIQSKVVLDRSSDFPALTICAHQQFALHAKDTWDAGALSPASFSRNVRKIAETYLLMNDTKKAENMLIYDLIRIYYQNLNMRTTVNISHELSSLLVYCVNFNQNGMFVGKVDDCGLKIKRFSSPDYFNCYTVMVKEHYSIKMVSLRLVLRFPHPKFPEKHMAQSFLQEMFRNAYGGQVVIHERNALPKVNRDRIHVEPGKLLEISYNNIQWKNADTPKNPCIDDAEKVQDIFDMKDRFRYSYEDCLDYHLATKVFLKCHCISASLPRIFEPNGSHPYCGRIGSNVSKDRLRFEKYKTCVDETIRIDKADEFRGQKCIRRCMEQKFKVHVSSTAWRPTEWQLYWLLRLSRAWSTIIDNPSKSKEKLEDSRRIVSQYLMSDNVEELQTHSNETLFNNEEDYACVVLRRESNTTLVKEGTVGLSLYGLVSRIGGSCSLYLGLTCAFFVELIEFCFLLKGSAESGKIEKGIILANPENNRRKSRGSNGCDYNESEDLVAPLDDVVWVRMYPHQLLGSNDEENITNDKNEPQGTQNIDQAM